LNTIGRHVLCYMRSGTKNNLVYYILPLKQIKIPIPREKVGNALLSSRLQVWGRIWHFLWL